jgi:glyoxalase family protein
MPETDEASIVDRLAGIHHVTALAADPQRNIDFYVGALGLRLVKKTVNFDAPDVYHLYYGDTTGRPGTILTFFPFPGSGRGRRGVGEIGSIAFSVTPDSLEYWIDRFSRLGVPFDAPSTRFGRELIAISDPDGMTIELVADPAADRTSPWTGGSVDPVHTLRRIVGAALSVRNPEVSGRFMVDVLRFRKGPREGDRTRLFVGEGDSEAWVDVLDNGGSREPLQSAGSIHHIAWRTPDDAGQTAWLETLRRSRNRVTLVQDRKYFRSVYFHEPGGILFEVATDGPGFTVDESVDELGTALCLPPWLESRRSRIERILPPVALPARLVRG